MTATALTAAAQGLVAAGIRYLELTIKRGLRTSVTREDDDTGERRTVNFHRWPNRKPFGLLLHSTGPGMEKYARTYGLSKIDTVSRVYGNPGNSCAHVVCLPDGTRVRVVSPDLVAPHCGVSGAQRRMMLDGTWRAWCSDLGEKLWGERWPGVKSPQHLFPTASPNDSYEGLEHWKLDANDPETGTPYTVAQYRSCAQWIVERERTWGFVAEGRRLVTHEDVQPFERWVASGGHDPGVLRVVPTYDWPLLLAFVAAEREVIEPGDAK